MKNTDKTSAASRALLDTGAEKVKHTPGPWATATNAGCKDIVAFDSDGAPVSLATTDGLDPEVVDLANAHLIAAAPEMLQTLRIARLNAKHNRLNDADPSAGCWTTCSACLIDKTIAQAEGRL